MPLPIYLSFININIMTITHLPLHSIFSTPCSSISSANTRLRFNVLSIPIPIYSLHHFSSSSQIPKAHISPIDHFLHKSCGLSPREAVSASKCLQHLKTTKKPERVVHFFRERGFSDAHIKAIVRSTPRVLASSIPNTLLPKLKLFEDLGFVDAQLADLISRSPTLLMFNVERKLLPGITFLQEQVKSNVNVVNVLRRAPWILSSLEKVKANMLFLQNNGIERRKLLLFLICNPQIMSSSEAKLKEILDTTEKLGVPRGSGLFSNAVLVVSCHTKDTLQHKINYLMSSGLSKEEVLQVFKKSPSILATSKENLKQHMDCLVNTLNFKPIVIVTYPSFLSYSIEKRILPRYKVFQMLQSMDALEIKVKFMTMLLLSENDFLNKIINKHSESTRLYKIYKGLDAAHFSVNYGNRKEVEPQ